MEERKRIDEESNRNLEAIKRQFRSWYEYIFFCSSFILFLRLAVDLTVPFFVPLLVLLAFQLTSLLRKWYEVIKNKNIIYSRFSKREALISTSVFIFYIYLEVLIFIPKTYLIFSAIPLLGIIATYLLFNVNYAYNSQKFTARLECYFFIIAFLVFFFVGLREVNFISWHWFYVFWPIWLMVTSLFLLGFCQIFYGCRQLSKSCKSEVNYSEILCHFILMYISIGTGICISYIFMCISLDNRLYLARLSTPLLAFFIYLASLFVLIFCFNSPLLNWAHKRFYKPVSSIRYDISQIPSLPENPLPPIMIDSQDYPRKMKKQSSGYYVVFDNLEEFCGNTEESFDSGKFCNVCCEKTCSAIFMNCGHAGICFQCACEVWKKINKCLICRSELSLILKYDEEVDGVAEISRGVYYKID